MRNKIYGECPSCKKPSGGVIFSLLTDWQPIAVGQRVEMPKNLEVGEVNIRLSTLCEHCSSALICKFVDSVYLGFTVDKPHLIEHAEDLVMRNVK